MRWIGLARPRAVWAWDVVGLFSALVFMAAPAYGFFDGSSVTAGWEMWSVSSPGAGGSLIAIIDTETVVAKPIDADMILAAFTHSDPTGEVSTTDNYETPSLARTEWEHINRVLTDCGGNISEAARKLGLHRRTLQRKLKTLPPQS